MTRYDIKMESFGYQDGLNYYFPKSEIDLQDFKGQQFIYAYYAYYPIIKKFLSSVSGVFSALLEAASAFFLVSHAIQACLLSPILSKPSFNPL